MANRLRTKVEDAFGNEYSARNLRVGEIITFAQKDNLDPTRLDDCTYLVVRPTKGSKKSFRSLKFIDYVVEAA
jgi:hypothetical protein